MKRIQLLLISILVSASGFSQFTGTGTSADPYSGGTLTGNQTWLLSNSPIYVSGDLTVGTDLTAGHLTIEAGVAIRFCSVGADLIVTGLGELTADGSPSNQILFTADTDKDGNYGESDETWGHISFQNMTSGNSSLIDNCIIEYGNKYTGNFEIESAGGGLYISYSNLIVSNSSIRNNYSGWGGGIYVSIASPSITNCIITNNIAAITGGGIAFYRDCNSIIQNCIFEKNVCNGGGGGGGVFLGDYPGDIKFYNCVFASNIGSNGANIRYYYSTTTRPKFYNTIVWGSNNSISYYNYTTDATDFNYCAIQGYSSGYTNCINLNSSNSASDGPNFIEPDNLNYAITLFSPCRDAGISSGAPANDFYGNSRVNNPDQGIFEVQYSRWKTNATSTTWNDVSNWEGGIPTVSRDVIIPAAASNYPTGSSAQDFTLGTDKQMIIEQGARVTLGNLTNNGIIKLNHNSSGFASLIMNSYTRGSGATEEIQLYLAGGGSELLEDYKWHYISSPVSSLSTSVFTGVTFDLAQFVESRPSGSLLEGWVAYDGYVYSTGVSNGPAFSNLTTGKGYNFWDNATNTFTFGGILNSTNVPISLEYSAPIQSLRGFNLLGNPFSSGLNWNDIINNIYFTYPANTSKSLYFTRDNIQCSYINGVGTPADVDGIIPPMQGFFTKTYATGNSITLPAAARTHNNIHARYKSGSIIPLVRIELRKDSISSDETVVRFDTEAKSELDYDFDAEKMFLSATKTQVYTVTSGTKFAINGQPFPASVMEIPVVVNITKDTIHTISATQLQGLEGYGVFLRDYTTGFNTDLKTTPVVTFTAAPGLITNRFALSFTTTGIKEPEKLSDKLFNIYPAYGLINIQSLSDLWDGKNGSVRVLDITGKTVGDIRNAEFSTNSMLQIAAPLNKGIYLVEIKAGAMRHVGKVVVR